MGFLFVSNFYDSIPCGAYNLTHSHYEALNNIAGGGEIISTLAKHYTEKPESGKLAVKCARSRIDSLRNRFSGKVIYYSNEAEECILNAVRNGSYRFVWFDQFIYGSAVKKIKREFPKLPVFVFYHTVTRPFFARMRHTKFNARYLLSIWDYLLLRKAAKLSAAYSDANIILNDRDGEVFRNRYGFEAAFTLPICLKDTAHIAEVKKDSDEFNILFVGGAVHKPNLDGIKWFAVNVMPKLDRRAVLHIVGADMDKVRNDREFCGNDRIRITGRTESLDDCYNMADLSVCPVFIGGGMMTKIAEALMYGKNILATGHSLNGYEGLDNCRCDTAEEFAVKINELIASGTSRYNPAMRKIYEESYSLHAMEEMLRKFLNGVDVI